MFRRIARVFAVILLLVLGAREVAPVLTGENVLAVPALVGGCNCSAAHFQAMLESCVCWDNADECGGPPCTCLKEQGFAAKFHVRNVVTVEPLVYQIFILIPAPAQSVYTGIVRNGPVLEHLPPWSSQDDLCQWLI